ncbi:MAG: YlxR family protein [Clostridia bacterium]|nr:YlxR family protein [Clostridia bacterium]
MIPIRSCITCKSKKPKSELIRIISKEENDSSKVFIDKLKIENARAIYICKDINCLDKCIKLIDKNKLVIRYNINKEKLKDCLLELKYEMGEKSWEK